MKLRAVVRLIAMSAISVAPLFFTCVALATDLAPPADFISEHPSAVGWVFAISVAVGVLGQGFWIVRLIHQNDDSHSNMLAQIEKNRKEANAVNEKQWGAIAHLTEDLGTLISQFNHLRGEHDVLKDHHHKRVGEARWTEHNRCENGDEL